MKKPLKNPRGVTVCVANIEKARKKLRAFTNVGRADGMDFYFSKLKNCCIKWLY